MADVAYKEAMVIWLPYPRAGEACRAPTDEWWLFPLVAVACKELTDEW
jgi:hypothetical protein